MSSNAESGIDPRRIPQVSLEHDLENSQVHYTMSLVSKRSAVAHWLVSFVTALGLSKSWQLHSQQQDLLQPHSHMYTLA